MFLTDDDYKALIDSDTLDYVISSEASTRETAEKYAQDEIKSYLSGKYDTAAIFAATEENRSDIIIMRMVDISLYNLFASQPERMGFQIRELRYTNTIDWLKQVAKGTVSLDLPTNTDSDGIPETIIKWGSQTKNNMDY